MGSEPLERQIGQSRSFTQHKQAVSFTHPSRTRLHSQTLCVSVCAQTYTQRSGVLKSEGVGVSLFICTVPPSLDVGTRPRLGEASMSAHMCRSRPVSVTAAAWGTFIPKHNGQ